MIYLRLAAEWWWRELERWCPRLYDWLQGFDDE